MTLSQDIYFPFDQKKKKTYFNIFPACLSSPYQQVTHIGEKIVITFIVEKMTESRLRWFEHIRRNHVEALKSSLDEG